jgi:hypothetical protein
MTCSPEHGSVTMRVPKPLTGGRRTLYGKGLVTRTDRAQAPRGISEATFHRWRKQYGGMSPQEAKRLKELEKENARLKKLVADQALDIDILKEVNRGNF